MQGMLSTDLDRTQGLRFYRMMSLVGVVTTGLFAFVFLFLVESEHELIWDRVIIGVFALFVYLVSYSKVRRKTFFQLCNLLFYIFSFQVIFSSVLSGWSIIHLLVMFITLQAISNSFKSLVASRRYLISVNAILLFLIFIFPPEEKLLGVFVVTAYAAASYLLMFIVRTKIDFQSKMKLQKELLLAIITKTEDSILITDFEGIIYESTAQAEKLFGYSIEELEGLDISDFRVNRLTDEEDRIGVSKLLKDKFWNDEVRMRRKDHSEFDAYISITWIHMFNLEYLVYRIRDVSAEKEAKLELIKAKEEAEAAAQAKAEFLATMSHEIRTPMNGVLGMTHLLSETALNQVQHKLVETIQTSGKNLLVIINDILDFSKVESGKMELEKRQFDLFKVIEEAIQLIQPQLDKKGILLTREIETTVPQQVVGDSTRIQQVLLNFLGNAVKFTEEGSIQLFVKTVSVSGKNLELLFSIKDTGIGIQESKMGNLFKSFSQVDSSTTRKYGGTGLGLAISKNLVEQMGGEVFVSSVLNEGSEFKFNLKLELPEFNDKMEEVHIEEVTEEDEFFQLSVLVAEDNVINQQVIAMLLKNMGVKTKIANNGKEVLEAVRDELFDVIFMDIQMPEMDGLEATELLLSKDEFVGRTPPIIAMTANAMDDDRDKCREVGMVDFVSKPINLNELKLVLKSISEDKLK